MEILFAFLGSYCPAILFNIERRNLIWAGICGALGWAAFDGIYSLSGSKIYAAFIASVIISLTSEIMAKVFKTPSTVFLVPSLFPIVPGIPAYYTVQYIIENNMARALDKGLETIGIAGAIAFGILMVSTIFKYVNARKRYNTAKSK